MIAGVTSRVIRPQVATVGMRQHVAARPDVLVSKRLAKLVTLIICLSLFVLFVFGQLMHWHVTSTMNQLNELRTVRSEFGTENIALLSTKARLTSKEYIVEQAGKRYQLFAPQKNQIHRL